MANTAQRKAAVFAKYDEEMIKRLAEHRKRYVSEVRRAQDEVMPVLQVEKQEQEV